MADDLLEEEECVPVHAIESPLEWHLEDRGHTKETTRLILHMHLSTRVKMQMQCGLFVENGSFAMLLVIYSLYQLNIRCPRPASWPSPLYTMHKGCVLIHVSPPFPHFCVHGTHHIAAFFLCFHSFTRKLSEPLPSPILHRSNALTHETPDNEEHN